MTNRDDWLTTAQAARLLGVTETRVRQLAADGKLTARKVGSTYRGAWEISRASVEARAAGQPGPGRPRKDD